MMRDYTAEDIQEVFLEKPDQGIWVANFTIRRIMDEWDIGTFVRITEGKIQRICSMMRNYTTVDYQGEIWRKTNQEIWMANFTMR